MTKEEIRDKVEDLYIKETNRFAFLNPNELDERYIEWLESKLFHLHQLKVESECCPKCQSKNIGNLSTIDGGCCYGCYHIWRNDI